MHAIDDTPDSDDISNAALPNPDATPAALTAPHLGAALKRLRLAREAGIISRGLFLRLCGALVAEHAASLPALPVAERAVAMYFKWKGRGAQ